MRIGLINARESKILTELSNVVYPLSSSALVRRYPCIGSDEVIVVSITKFNPLFVA